MPQLEDRGTAPSPPRHLPPEDAFDAFGTFNDELHEADDDGPPHLPLHLEPRARRTRPTGLQAVTPPQHARATPRTPEPVVPREAWLMGGLTLGLSVVSLVMALMVS